jgi:transposase
MGARHSWVDTRPDGVVAAYSYALHARRGGDHVEAIERAFGCNGLLTALVAEAPHSQWVSQLIEKCGHQVTIADPRRLKVISASNTKTDRRDAELLARLRRADESLLAPVKHRDNEVQADLAVAGGFVERGNAAD